MCRCAYGWRSRSSGSTGSGSRRARHSLRCASGAARKACDHASGSPSSPSAAFIMRRQSRPVGAVRELLLARQDELHRPRRDGEGQRARCARGSRPRPGCAGRRSRRPASPWKVTASLPRPESSISRALVPSASCSPPQTRQPAVGELRGDVDRFHRRMMQAGHAVSGFDHARPPAPPRWRHVRIADRDQFRAARRDASARSCAAWRSAMSADCRAAVRRISARARPAPGAPATSSEPPPRPRGRGAAPLPTPGIALGRAEIDLDQPCRHAPAPT